MDGATGQASLFDTTPAPPPRPARRRTQRGRPFGPSLSDLAGLPRLPCHPGVPPRFLHEAHWVCQICRSGYVIVGPVVSD